jgi:integrase/recombinase XerD
MERVDLIEEFHDNLQTRHLSETTIRQYPLYVLKFSYFVGGDLLAVDKETLTRYLEHLQRRNVGQTSIKRYFAGLSAFYNFMVFRDYIAANTITPAFRTYYLTERKNHDASQRRKCPTIQEAQKLVQNILDPKDRAVVVLFLKTGIRLGELSRLDMKDVDMENMTIRIKPTAKRSNEIVYFDGEAAYVIQKWLIRREKENTKKIDALFLDRYGKRLSSVSISRLVNKYAVVSELHDPSSDRHDLQKRLTPHCLRHFWTTQMIDAGMQREYVKELRGDSRHEAIDVYHHISRERLKRAYMAYVPQLGLL